MSQVNELFHNKFTEIYILATVFIYFLPSREEFAISTIKKLFSKGFFLENVTNKGEEMLLFTKVILL